MSVVVRYRTGAMMSYSLNAFCPCEGYRVSFSGDAGRIEYVERHASHIITGADKEPRSCVGVSLSETEATLAYPGDTTVRLVALASEGGIAVHVAGRDQTVERLIFQAIVPFQFSDGGSWRIADGARRARQIIWNGTNRNSSDRGGWGRAVLR